MDGRQPLLHLILIAIALLTGCAGSGSDDDRTRRGGPSCTPPEPTTVSLATTIQPIFDVSCAVGGCHVGAVPPAGLDLSAGESRDDTVGIPSTQQPQVDRIVAGDPDASYLVRKIEGAPGIGGELMPQGCPGTPLNGALCLDGDRIAAIRTWITECALDN